MAFVRSGLLIAALRTLEPSVPDARGRSSASAERANLGFEGAAELRGAANADHGQCTGQAILIDAVSRFGLLVAASRTIEPLIPDARERGFAPAECARTWESKEQRSYATRRVLITGSDRSPSRTWTARAARSGTDLARVSLAEHTSSGVRFPGP